MLSSLKIKNVALIKELRIDFFNGLNILSGETGAGKSIIIDSLGFVLGGKADKSMIRSNEEKCEVFATFELNDDDLAVSALQEMGYDRDTTIVIHRTLDTVGKTKCFINGANSSLGMLKTLTQYLCDIHGQSEHHSLMNIAMQLELLDKFGGTDILECLTEYKKIYMEYKNIQKQIDSFGFEGGDRERHIDMLKYQIAELETSDIKQGELEQLQSERTKISNLDRLLKALGAATCHLGDGDTNMLEQLSSVIQELEYAQQYDEKIKPQTQRLQSLQYEIEDISQELQSIFDGYDTDESSEIILDKIQNRIEVIKTLYRKYGGDYSSLMAYYNSATNDLQRFLQSDKLIEELHLKKTAIEKQLAKSAEALTKIRKATAENFKQNIIKQFLDLGLKNTKFECMFENTQKYTSLGKDSMQFYMSANLGQAMKPLEKVISGGEASRFMLALKTITSDIDRIPLMVFDEIDTGISGEIAQMVAVKFAKIAKKHQLIAITHLPQISAMGDNNYLIEKVVNQNTTITNVKHLNEIDKQKEVARLAGGSNIGQHGILHAKELIDWCSNQKKICEEKQGND